jgi:heme exporter protein D
MLTEILVPALLTLAGLWLISVSRKKQKLDDALKIVSTVILATSCLLISVVLLPWAELGFSGKFPDWLNWAMTPHVTDFFYCIPGKEEFTKFLQNQGARANFGDYAYSLFMCLAITIAAVAIVIVGREDAEEKTVLPIKK